MDSAASPRQLTRRAFDAVIFDLDGVLTDTAALHARAWKALFDPVLEAHGQGPFDARGEYKRLVDGRRREDGIRALLAARGIAIDADELRRMADRKNAHFQRLLREGGVPSLPENVAFLKRVRAAGFRTAMVSASRNAPAIVEAAGLLDCFDTLVSGIDAAAENLAGKPQPDTFLAAAKRLGVPPMRCVVVEDAQSGVAAGKAGGFGLVIGVAGPGASVETRRDLEQHGADLVVDDLSAVPGEAGAPRRDDALPSALERLDAIFDAARGRRLAFFLDYDGTLTPIVSRPQDAKLSPEMRETLARLARACTVAIVSGRGLADVRDLVGAPELIYAGSHGFEIAGPEGLSVQAERGTEFLPALDEMEARLRERLETVEGALVERKRFSIAVHYRLVDPEAQSKVDDAVGAELAAHEGFRKGLGKKVYEIQPNIDWHKGKAVRFVMEALGLDLDAVLPVYVGDDVTDEDAFHALADDGLGILVLDAEEAGAGAEGRETAARYALASPAEVQRFFEAVLNRLDAEGDR